MTEQLFCAIIPSTNLKELKMENQEAIMSELYSIKAGLSVIANEANKIRAIKEIIENSDNEIKNNEYRLHDNDSVPYNEERKKKAISGIVAFSIKLAIRLLIIAGCFMGAYFSFSAVFREVVKLGQGIEITQFIVHIILSVILPAIGLFVLAFPKLPPKIKDLTYNIGELKSASAYLNEKAEKRATLDAQNQELVSIKREAEAELENQLKISVPFVKITYNCLLDNYQNYIKECDFGNVDLIIHYIYSGRALDVRDALLQTDAHIRHNELIDVFEREARAIRASVDSGFDRMQDAVNRGFVGLGDQLRKQHEAEMSKLGDVNSAIDRVNTGINSVASAQAIQNAYSANISKNSQQLVKDTSEILYYVRTRA